VEVYSNRFTKKPPQAYGCEFHPAGPVLRAVARKPIGVHVPELQCAARTGRRSRIVRRPVLDIWESIVGMPFCRRHAPTRFSTPPCLPIYRNGRIGVLPHGPAGIVIVSTEWQSHSRDLSPTVAADQAKSYRAGTHMAATLRFIRRSGIVVNHPPRAVRPPRLQNQGSTSRRHQTPILVAGARRLVCLSIIQARRTKMAVDSSAAYSDSRPHLAVRCSEGMRLPTEQWRSTSRTLSPQKQS